MKRLLILVFVACAGIAQASLVWYAGDFDGRDGLRSQEGGTLGINGDARAYDNFTLSSTTVVTDVYGKLLSSITPQATTAYWDIRIGVSPGVEGTIVAGGFASICTVTPTGRSGFGYTEY